MPQLEKQYRGKGWWGENIRHSLARKFGRAGVDNPLSNPPIPHEERVKQAKKKFSKTIAGRKKLFTPPQEYIEYDETENWHRFRLRDPEEFNPSGFGRNDSFRTIPRKGGRVHIVIGKLKGKKGTTVQSIRYRKIKYGTKR